MNTKKYFNSPTLMQGTYLVALVFFLKYVFYINGRPDIYSAFLCALPFLINMFILLCIKKYEQFYSRDILILFFVTIFSVFIILGLFIYSLVTLHLI